VSALREQSCRYCRGCATQQATAQSGEDFSGFPRGDGAFAEGADAGVGSVTGLLPPGQPWAVAAVFERRADAAASALVALIDKGHHIVAGRRVDDPVGAGGVEVVDCAGGRCRRAVRVGLR
jgi:hypothetical protein